MTKSSSEDASLWVRLIEGDPQAFSALFLKYASSLFRYGFLLCHDRQKVEDCVQDLFFRLWQNHKQLKEVHCVKTYLLVALHHRIQSTFRIRSPFDISKGLKPGLATEAGVEEIWISNETDNLRSLLLHRSIGALPQRMKQVVYLRYFENLGYVEIAKIMNIQKQVAINMVYRAIAHLRAFSQKNVIS